MTRERRTMRSEQELEAIALELFKSLKPQALAVCEILEVIDHMKELVNHIVYAD